MSYTPFATRSMRITAYGSKELLSCNSLIIFVISFLLWHIKLKIYNKMPKIIKFQFRLDTMFITACYNLFLTFHRVFLMSRVVEDYQQLQLCKQSSKITFFQTVIHSLHRVINISNRVFHFTNSNIVDKLRTFQHTFILPHKVSKIATDNNI